jgi:hypothetical protein
MTLEGQLKTRQAPGTSFEPYLIPVLADPKKLILVLLAVVLEQQTELQPTQIMTDTGA